METEQKIIERMRKLLNMAEDSANENESAIAMKRLHSMLAKHNMSVESLRPEDKANIGEEGFESVNWPWRRIVMMGVSELYFCKNFYTPTRKNYATYTIVGTESNRVFAAAMINVIFHTIEREAKSECKKLHGCANSTYITSFRTAAANKIYHRCKDLIKAAKEGSLEDDDGSLLPVMVSTYDSLLADNKNYVEEMYPHMRSSTTRSRARDRNAEVAGRAAGGRVQLSKGIQSKNATKLLN